jgi:hypothetical protein
MMGGWLAKRPPRLEARGLGIKSRMAETSPAMTQEYTIRRADT